MQFRHGYGDIRLRTLNLRFLRHCKRNQCQLCYSNEASIFRPINSRRIALCDVLKLKTEKMWEKCEKVNVQDFNSRIKIFETRIKISRVICTDLLRIIVLRFSIFIIFFPVHCSITNMTHGRCTLHKNLYKNDKFVRSIAEMINDETSPWRL